MKTTLFENILEENGDYLDIDVVPISFERSMSVAKYTWGYIIEAEMTEDDGSILLETLVTNDSKVATLIGREWFTKYGVLINGPHLRDTIYPVGCTVRLKRKVETCC